MRTSSEPSRASDWQEGAPESAARLLDMIASVRRMARRSAELETPAIVALPAEAGLWDTEPVRNLVLAAWLPGVEAVIADMTRIRTWRGPCVTGLAQAHSDLAARRTGLRVVVWSPDLYTALCQGISYQLPIYASVHAALSVSDSA
jgi:hypothetical protein